MTHIVSSPFQRYSHIFVIFALFFAFASTKTCQFQQNITAEDRLCAYTYNYTSDSCNMTSFQQSDLLFVSCKKKNTNQPEYQLSSNLTNCDSFCKQRSSFSSTDNSFVIITLVAIAVIILIFLAACLFRRCLCPQPVRQISNQIIVITSQRRLRASGGNYGQFEQEWDEIEAVNFQWIQEKQVCAICLQSKNNIRLGCKHYFHYKCIKQWILIKDECPTCKSQDIQMPIILCMSCKKKQLLIPQIHYLLLELNDQCSNCQA